MGSTDESIPSKMLAVLCQINARLEEQDRRLQDIYSALRTVPAAKDQGDIPTTVVSFDSFEVKQREHPDGKRQLQEIKVFGQELLALLQTVANNDGYCPARQPDAKPRTYVYPFTNLVNYWDALEILAGPERSEFSSLLSTTTVSSEAQVALRDMLRCIKTASNCQEYYEERCTNAGRSLVRFDHLPSLFAPGSLLVRRDEQVVEVSFCEFDSTSRPNICVVKYWHYDWTRKFLRKIGGQFEVERYNGTSHLDTFPCCPLTALEAKSARDVVNRSIRNGKRPEFLDQLTTPNGEYLCGYNGMVVISGNKTKYYDGRVIIDPEAYAKRNTSHLQLHRSSLGCSCKTCAKTLCINYASLPKRRLLLMPSSVPAYALELGKWVRISVKDLREVTYRTLLLDDLQVSNTILRNTMSQIETYLKEKRTLHGRPIDIFSGAPRVVFQLHGPVGAAKRKVLTTLAEHCRLPLLYLPVPDFGFEPADFEESLDEAMSLASRWGAVLAIEEADGLLEAGHLREGLFRSVLVEALPSRIRDFYGICVFLTSRVSALDPELRTLIKTINLEPTPVSRMSRILRGYLNGKCVNGGAVYEILEWLEATATSGYAVTLDDIPILVQSAWNLASAQSRKINLGDILEAYTAKTGRLEEWDVVTELSLYSCVFQYQTPQPQMAETLRRLFHSAWPIPDDGRVTLAFSQAYLQSHHPCHQLSGLLDQISNFTMTLRQNFGELVVVDWGWPKRLWSPQEGCLYEIHASPKNRQARWDLAGFSYGLRRLVGDDGKNLASIGKPWRRLLLCQGLASVPRYVDGLGWPGFIDYHCFGNFPWWVAAKPADDSLSLPVRHPMISLHLECAPRRRYMPTHNGHISDTQGFHIVFYELLNPVDLPSHPDMRHTTRFYDKKLKYLRKSCFTMLHVPSQEEGGDPIHWTIVCLTPTKFWPSKDSYAISASPSLRAQACQYVAKALADVSLRWRAILDIFDEVFDNSKVLREPDRLQDILFDDDAFSTSKRYFWAINFLQDSVNMIDEIIREWNQYHKTSVDPFRKGYIESERTEDYVKKSQAVLKKANTDAIEACAELNHSRQAFQDRLEQIKMMRDGLFNASAVMESRAATRLGENVKLLTFISIFFLPLAFCTSIWSVNDSYSRTTLVIVATIVAVFTYLVTLNLNNLVQLIRSIYSPQRRKMVDSMEQSRVPKWSDLGYRFKAFERLENGIHEPSEWMIVVFSIRQIYLTAVDIISCRRFRRPT